MAGRLDGKVALVTGVSDGIGGAIARRFAAEGAKVACTGVQMAHVEAAAAEISDAGGCALARELDVRSEDEWKAALDATIAAFGGLDVLVNNAGVLLLASIAATTLEDFRRVFDVNADGTFLGLRHGVLAMRPGGAAGNGGSIINISSVAAGGATVDHVAYGASKAAVSAMTRHAASECAAHGYAIRVNSICPGVVQTGMLVDTPENLERCNGSHPLGLGKADDVASAAIYLAADDSRWVTGTELVIDGGWSVRP